MNISDVLNRFFPRRENEGYIDEDYDENGDFADDYEEEPTSERYPQRAQDDEEEPAPRQRMFGRPKVVSMPDRSGASIEVEAIRPQSVNDAETIIQMLLDGHLVLIDTSETTSMSSQRVIDMVGGAVCAIKGEIRAVNERSCIFIAVPKNVNLSGEFVQDIMNRNDMQTSIHQSMNRRYPRTVAN